MAEPNTLWIDKEGDGPAVVKVSGANGNKKDISSHFRKIAGTTTPGGFTNEAEFGTDTTATVVVTFSAIDKHLIYTLNPMVAKQLVALADD
jgi:hypothetical protein